jgi:acyl-CoA hydrolase
MKAVFAKTPIPLPPTWYFLKTQYPGKPDGRAILNWLTSQCHCHRHCRRVVVTAAVNNVSFQHPIKLGDLVVIGKVQEHLSSMEVFMDIFETWFNRERTNAMKPPTFVAVDQLGNPFKFQS